VQALRVFGDELPRLDVVQVREILPHLIDALSDAVLVVDRRRRIVAANRRYVDVFGRDAALLVGQTCHDVVHCPEAANGSGQQCVACEVLTERQPRRMVRTLPDARGALRRWEGTLNPVLDGAGEVTHVVEVWRDITERSQLEAQLSHNERLASLGVLAAGVAHEINNPLASILAGVESMRRWLRRAGKLDPERVREAEEVIGILERETQRSRETTDKLMQLAQPYHSAASWVDLNRAVRDTLSLLKYEMRKHSVTLTEALDPALPAIWARESAMRGMLMNLCLNAVQAMPLGGTLSVRTASLGSDRVRVEIADTGEGIDPAHVDLIWTPFFTTKPVGKGTGLGLSITQGIVDRHGGTIGVESTRGAGAKFVIDLPVEGPGGEHV
jgi:hypothetical protein